MRHNNNHKPSNNLDRYDRVYIDIPQCPWLHSMVAEPLKTVYYNQAADRDANIVRMLRDVQDLERFAAQNRIDLF